MKQKDMHKTIGVLVTAGEYRLAQEFVILAAKNFPAENAPPANISKRAENLWKTHVWPKYKKSIKAAGDVASQWRAAVAILKRSAENRGIAVWTWDEGVTASTAQETYSERAKELAQVMNSVHKKLKVHSERAKRNPENWGFASDLGHVLKELLNIDKFLGN